MEDKAVKFDRYGTLITVASLLFVIIYSNDPYDGWDLIISGIAGTFGILYLKEKAYFDFFSTFLGFLIALTGIIFTIISIIEIPFPGTTEPIKGVVDGFNIILLVIFSLSLVLAYNKQKTA